jgi:hypothetical protein
MYKLTVTYDENLATRQTWTIQDPLEAFSHFLSFKDWGFADEFSTVNLELPTGKMYTRIFYRNGSVVTR